MLLQMLNEVHLEAQQRPKFCDPLTSPRVDHGVWGVSNSSSITKTAYGAICLLSPLTSPTGDKPLLENAFSNFCMIISLEEFLGSQGSII